MWIEPYIHTYERAKAHAYAWCRCIVCVLVRACMACHRDSSIRDHAAILFRRRNPLDAGISMYVCMVMHTHLNWLQIHVWRWECISVRRKTSSILVFSGKRPPRALLSCVDAYSPVGQAQPFGHRGIRKGSLNPPWTPLQIQIQQFSRPFSWVF
jgi:hypothetical protein